MIFPTSSVLPKSAGRPPWPMHFTLGVHMVASKTRWPNDTLIHPENWDSKIPGGRKVPKKGNPEVSGDPKIGSDWQAWVKLNRKSSATKTSSDCAGNIKGRQGC